MGERNESKTLKRLLIVLALLSLALGAMFNGLGLFEESLESELIEQMQALTPQKASPNAQLF